MRFLVYGRGVLIGTLAASLLATPRYAFADSGMSGLALNSLAKAYEAIHVGKAKDAPFTLQPFVVIVIQRGGVVQVSFDNHVTQRYRNVNIEAQTGRVVDGLDFTQRDYGEILLPGIVAGELVAAYDYALSDSRVPSLGIAKLQTGSYNVFYEPTYTGLYIAFLLELHSPPPMDVLSVAATPTPSPHSKCIAGACEGQVIYTVTLQGGQPKFVYHAVL